jgi:NAD(P)H-hydrate repair Nnr-like enzyme with NAD(P)H-hydrate epimerase domain
MTELLTAAQMRALEAAAIASGAVTGLELMERAGQGVVAAIFGEWPEFAVATEGGAAPQTDFCDAKKRPPPEVFGPR